MLGRRLGVAEIGRRLPTDTTDKHHIKAVDRFLGNDKVDLVGLWESVIALACRGQSLFYVLLDWTDLHNGGFETLRASVSYAGRSQPIAWATTRKGHYGRSRNCFETNLCKLVRSLLPPGIELVVVADRGFVRASLFRALNKAGIRFIVRARKDIHLIHGRGKGPLEYRSIVRGRVRDLVDACYGEDARLCIRCVISWGVPTGIKAKRPWYLITNLRPEQVSVFDVARAYYKRMRIEQGFRDDKSMRFGFQLRSVRLSTCERYDRLFAIAALAMLLLVNIGAYAERRGLAKRYKANTDPRRTHSLFHLGLDFLTRITLRAPRRRLFRLAFSGQLDTASGELTFAGSEAAGVVPS